MEKYLQPKSLTWWTGVSSISIGAAKAAGNTSDLIGTAGDVIGMMSGLAGAASPAQLIVLGFGLIGLRGAIFSTKA